MASPSFGSPLALYRSLPRAFWLLWVGALVNRLGNCVVPMLTIYLTRERGVPLSATGFLMALFGCGSLIGSLAGGVLADRLGRRATMLVSLLGAAGVMLLLGQARTLPALGACLFFQGLCFDLFRPASQAYVADVVEPKDRLRAFGVLYWAFNIGFAVASTLAGFIGDKHFDLLFLIDAGTTLVFAGFVAFKLQESRPTEKPMSHQAQGHVLTPFLDPVFAPFLFLGFLIFMVFLQFQVALPADLGAKGFSMREYGAVIGINGLLIALVQPFATRHVERFSRTRVLAVASLMIGAGFALNNFVGPLGVAMLSVAVWTLGELLMFPTNASIVADLSPAHLRGRYSGASTWSFSLALLLAPVVGTAVIERFGAGVLWWGSLAVGAAVALGHWASGARRRLHLSTVPGASGLTD